MSEFFELNVVACKQISADYFDLRLEVLNLAPLCKPGMFFELKAKTASQERKLFKPISVAGISEDRISFIIKAVGSGTSALADNKPGDTLLALGPLGNSFPMVEGKNVLLVSGGVGWPPLAFLKKILEEKNNITHVHGGACASDIFPCDLAYTVDGSAGKKGLVTQDLLEIINDKSIDIIYSCGPLPMIGAVQKMAQEIPHYASFEAYMACGLGACHGCVLPVGESYLRVCADGPVFNAAEIRWEEL